jgi:carboxypeptidase family protein
MRTRILFFVFLLTGARLGAEDLISLGYGEGPPGAQGISVAVTARHDQPIHGFSLAIAYPRSALSLLEINARGTSTEAVGVDFFQQTLDDAAGTAVAGAILSLQEPYVQRELAPTVPGGMPQLIAWLVFNVVPGAPVGEQKILLQNGIGDPPASNRFTYRGTTIRPALEDGTFMVTGDDDVMTLEWKSGFPGFRLTPTYAFAKHPRPLQGFQMAVSFDPRALDLEEVTFTGTSMLSLLGGSSKIEFVQIRWLPDEIAVSSSESRTTAGIVFDTPPYNDSQVLPPETTSPTRQSILRFSFQPKETAGQFGEYIPLTLSESSAPDAINNAFIAGSESFTPKKVDGRIYFSTGSLSGTVNAFGSGSPIAGATVVLDPGGYSASTRADGTFLFPDIPPGPYSALASRAGFFPARGPGAVGGLGEVSTMGPILLFAVPPSTGGGFRRGRINGDGQLDISDCIFLLGFMYLSEGTITCLDAADVNDDGTLDVSDVISMLGYIFLGGKAPATPFSSCGTDPTADSLDCQSFPACGQ